MYGTRRCFLLGGASVLVTMMSSRHAAGRVAKNPSARTRTRQVDAVLEKKIKSISNVFEVGRPEPDFGYVEDLHDGRGYTVTNYGFCTSTGEVSRLIRRYAASAKHTPLRRFLDVLPPVRGGSSTPDDFPEAWHSEATRSQTLAGVCDREADRLFFKPAMRVAAAAHIRTPIGKAVFYDTWLQHGGDGDQDSFQAIYSRTIRRVGKRKNSSEANFIRAFLNERKAVLLHASDPATRTTWQKSAPRVDALLTLLDDNPQLQSPITVTNSDVNVTFE
jgi:chitosanase